jgi:hypothetical protein
LAIAAKITAIAFLPAFVLVMGLEITRGKAGIRDLLVFLIGVVGPAAMLVLFFYLPNQGDLLPSFSALVAKGYARETLLRFCGFLSGSFFAKPTNYVLAMLALAYVAQVIPSFLGRGFVAGLREVDDLSAWALTWFLGYSVSLRQACVELSILPASATVATRAAPGLSPPPRCGRVPIARYTGPVGGTMA